MIQLSLLADEQDESIEIPEHNADLWQDPTPSVQWSYSAHVSMRRCQLQFFYATKMAAWNATKDEQRRNAFLLEQLQDLPRWRGRLVDYELEHFFVPYLQAGKLPLLDDVIRHTLEIARRQWEFSAQRRYRLPGITKGSHQDDFCALYPHEYGLPVGQQELRQVEEEVATALQTLYSMTDFLKCLSDHRTFRPQFVIQFPFERARVKAVLDLIAWRGSRCSVIDWKAVESETSDYTWQMLVYALAIKRQWPTIRPENITVFEVQLLDGTVKEHSITEERLMEAEDFIYQSVFEMEALTQGKSYAEQNIEDYEPANTSRTCATCNFRKMCLHRRV